MIVTQDYFPDIGGITTWCFEFAKAFAELGKEVLIVTKSYDNYKFNNEIVKDEHNLYVLRLDHSKWKNKRNILIYKAIKPLINDDTIFIAANWKMAVACFFHSIFRSINYVAVVHGLDAIENRKINKYLQFKAFQNADFVLAVSSFTKNLLLSQFKSSNFKISIINGGVDISKFNINTQSNGIATKYNLKDGFRIISLARLVKRKGFDFTIKAQSVINDKSIHYYIAGTGNYETSLRELVIELNLQDNVHFIGFIPDEDVAALYSSCDVYSMPSRQLVNDVEGFGLTYLEAAACGITSIGAFDSGAEDAIIHNKTGILVNAESITEIADAILLLKNNPQLKNQLATNAFERATKHFQWQTMANKILSLLAENQS